MRAFVFYLFFLGVFGKDIVLLLDTHLGKQPVDEFAFREILHALYSKNKQSHDRIKLFTFASEAREISEWIKLTDSNSIQRQIQALQFQKGACANWTAAFEKIDAWKQNTTKMLIFAVDEAPCHQTNFLKTREKLISHGWFIFAVGFGSFVKESDLQRIAGPCGLMGCLHGVNYAHLHTVNDQKIHLRSAHISIRGIIKAETGNIGGVNVQLEDACSNKQSTVTDREGNFYFSACNGEATLQIITPMGFSSLNDTTQKLNLGNGTLVLDPIFLYMGSIGEGPLSAGEIVAICIVGTLLFLVFSSCIYQTCNFALFMQKQKIY